MNREKRAQIMAWVGREILPHEADVRAWLRRTLDPDDLEDVIQETYCQIAGLKDVGHIRSGRAYFFTAARSIVLMRLRRARIVSIESVTEIESLHIVGDEPSPERVAAGRRELDRVRRLIEGLPDRCRRIFELRKIEGLPQREVAERLGVAEHVVENDVIKGLKLILQAIAEGEQAGERKMTRTERDERARNSTSDQ
ncbi:RNA polymerase sigma factor [Sphingopyxis fribergensis]